MDSPFMWTTDESFVLHLAEDAPASVEWHVMQSAVRLVERRVATRTGDPDLEGKRANLQFVRRMLTSTREKAMCADDKCMPRTIAANGLWPRKRQADAGYPVDPLCEKCGAGVPDTVHHRAWCCQ